MHSTSIRPGFLTLLATIGFITTPLTASAIKFDLYSENGYSGREQYAFSSLRLRTEHATTETPVLYPYVVGGTELQTSGLGSNILDPRFSYAYLGPGVKVPLGRFTLRGEARFRKQIHESPLGGEFDTMDFRANFVYADFLDRPMGWGPWILFLEPNSETLFTSGDFNNVIHSSYVRLGMRFPVGADSSLDVLGEPLLTLDRVGHYYNNHADLLFGLRWLQSFGPVSLSVTGSYVFSKTFSWGTFEPNPYQNSNSGLRLMAVLGGLL